MIHIKMKMNMKMIEVNELCKFCNGVMIIDKILYETLTRKKVKLKCKNCNIEYQKDLNK